MKKGKQKFSYNIINGITLYRIIAAPFLLVLLFTGHYLLFKWLLAISFFTDFIDGYLSRLYKVSSILGTKLDSIGDDLTIVVAMIGLFVMNSSFIKQEIVLFILLFILFIVQTIYSLIRYGKISSFHTYTAKVAAILQGIFLLLFFFMNKPIMLLFYTAAIVTIVDLIEEIILVSLLPHWKANVKGLYQVLKKRR